MCRAFSPRSFFGRLPWASLRSAQAIMCGAFGAGFFSGECGFLFCEGIENGLADDLPAALKRRNDDRLNDEEDVVGGGVVGADHGALGGVQRALKEGAEDGGLDVGPVMLSGGVEDAEVGVVERDGGVVRKEAAVEVRDVLHAEVAVIEAHSGEEIGQLAIEGDRRMTVSLDEAAEGVIGEEADGVREEAEDEAHQEMRDLFARGLRGDGLLQLDALGEAKEVGGGGLRNTGCGEFGPELVVVAEDVAEDFQRRERGGSGVAGIKEIVQREGVDTAGRVLKLGVDLEANEVADDEERGIFQSFVVLVQLAISLGQVTTLGFVFPGEPAALPDVSDAFLGAADLADSLLKGVTGTDLVDLGRMRDAEGLAQ